MDWPTARRIALGAGIDMAGRIGGAVAVIWLAIAMIIGSAQLALWLMEAVR